MKGFYPTMTVQEVNELGMLALAHVGDAVYELLFRSELCLGGRSSVMRLHKLAVSNVNAHAQAKAAERIMPSLTADEIAVYKRGRNTKVNSVPHNAKIGEYHSATGLEALFGWLYLQGRIDRINELFTLITEDTDNAT